ncbi:hypothetical protein [Streptomyces cellostaticus]|nr:hypothetical protein [Streptomyces cellostaticus]
MHTASGPRAGAHRPAATLPDRLSTSLTSGNAETAKVIDKP